jgi:NADH dehydrogenase [ubiquinone] 1 alpha subcomplex assembly factor 7
LAVRRDALLTRTTPDQAQAIRAACQRLTDPAAMGDLFKVLALTQPALPVPEGFTGATP